MVKFHWKSVKQEGYEGPGLHTWDPWPSYLFYHFSYYG